MIVALRDRLRGSDTQPVAGKAVVGIIILGVGVGDQSVRLSVIDVVADRAAAFKKCFILLLEACRVDHEGGFGVFGGGFIGRGARRDEVFGFADAAECLKVAFQLGGFGVEWTKPPRAEEGGLVASVDLKEVGRRS